MRDQCADTVKATSRTPALEQLKQRIDVQLILTKEVHRLGQNRL
jgi:hypothetical protein